MSSTQSALSRIGTGSSINRKQFTNSNINHSRNTFGIECFKTNKHENTIQQSINIPMGRKKLSLGRIKRIVVMGMYDYGQRGTYLNGFLTYIHNNNPEIKIETYGDLNEHLKAIRLRKEPKKPASNSIEKNSFYIQEKYDWELDVVSYFQQLKATE